MPDYDDAISPIGGDETPSRRSQRATGGNPVARVWAAFLAQPTQTKVIIVGVIVVLGVVAWMALRKKTPVDTSSEDVSGAFRPLGASSRMGINPGLPTPTVPPTALPPTSVPSSASTSAPRSTGILAPVTTGATALQTPTPSGDQPAAFRPPATWPVTPAGSSQTPTEKRTDVSLSGTITPINQTKVAPIGYTKTGPTPQTTRPTVLSAVPTQRGVNVSF